MCKSMLFLFYYITICCCSKILVVLYLLIVYFYFMMLIEKLREATQHRHKELDEAIMPYLKNIRFINDYVQLLIAFYGFFKPVYDKIDSHLILSFLPDYNTRRKPDSILQNLASLHRYEIIENIAGQIPAISNNASAFGALYVMEGSTLGGLMIKKMLSDTLSLSDAQLSFFAGYGKQTRERWNYFVQALNGFTANPAEEQAAITSANDTFLHFKNWLLAVYLK